MEKSSRTFRYIVAVAVLAAWMILSCFSVRAAQPFELHLLDVGQGQSVLVEADIAKKLLEEAGIAALVMDREDSGAYLRIIGLGSPFGMDVYVNRMYEAQAKQLIKEAFSQKEDLSDQELEELAMETHSDEV